VGVVVYVCVYVCVQAQKATADMPEMVQLGPKVMMMPFMLHTINLSLFASLIAPFGGACVCAVQSVVSVVSVVACCSVLQRAAACCNLLLSVAVCCSLLQCCSVSQRVAARRSVLQRVAACCSMFQCGAA